MTNKGMQVKKKVRSNPLQRRARNIVRPRTNFNGQTLDTTVFVDATISASNLSADFHVIDCNSAVGFNRSATSITANYQEYKYTKASLEFLPFFGPSSTEAPGRIFIGYIDNPEHITAFKALTTTQKVAAVKGLSNVRTYSAWERFTYNVPLTFRRKLWNVNLTQSAPTAEESERSTQGMVVVGIETISAAVVLGRYVLRSRSMLSGLSVVLST